jgi:hypothetical protein
MNTIINPTRGQRDEAILRSRGIPTSFGRWAYCSWNKTQLILAISLLGGDYLTDDSKRNLFSRLNQLRPAASPVSEQELGALRASRLQGRASSRTSVLNALNSAVSTVVKTESYTDSPYPGQTFSTSLGWTSSASTTIAQPQAVPDCEVCADSITSQLRLTQNITQQCQHSVEVAICKTCVEHHISVQITSHGWDRISCPVQDCRHILQYNDLQNMAATTDFQRYDAHLFERAMGQETNSDYRRCAHPDCTGGGWCYPEIESFMTCPACAQRTCVECNVVWHSEKTCAEHKEEVRIRKEREDAENAVARAADEVKSVEFVEANSKACPNEACGVPIQKNFGCDHMTCRQCRHQFCCLCLADYEAIRSDGNTTHMPDCANHTNQITKRKGGRLGTNRFHEMLAFIVTEEA